MLRNVFIKTLRDQRRSLLWWGVGLATLVVYTVALYPTIRENPAIDQLLESYPESLKSAFMGGEADFTSPPGYLAGSLFSLMLPLLALIYAVGQGTNAIAGEEERRTIDLLLANPVSRSRIVIDKFLALVATLGILAVVVWLLLWLGANQVQMDISPTNLGAGVALAMLVALLFGTIALTIGAVTGKRAISTGITAALGVTAYLVNSQAPRVEPLQNIQFLSPFYYSLAGSPLRNGLAWDDVAALLVPCFLLVGIALWAFNRRDVAV